MMKKGKLLFYSVLTLFLYFLFYYSPLFEGILEKLKKSDNAYNIGYYILIKIGGWFLLLFGCLGLLLFLNELLKSKWRN